jgi:hypothetical protein
MEGIKKSIASLLIASVLMSFFAFLPTKVKAYDWPSPDPNASWKLSMASGGEVLTFARNGQSLTFNGKDMIASIVGLTMCVNGCEVWEYKPTSMNQRDLIVLTALADNGNAYKIITQGIGFLVLSQDDKNVCGTELQKATSITGTNVDICIMHNQNTFNQYVGAFTSATEQEVVANAIAKASTVAGGVDVAVDRKAAAPLPANVAYCSGPEKKLLMFPLTNYNMMYLNGDASDTGKKPGYSTTTLIAGDSSKSPPKVGKFKQNLLDILANSNANPDLTTLYTNTINEVLSDTKLATDFMPMPEDIKWYNRFYNTHYTEDNKATKESEAAAAGIDYPDVALTNMLLVTGFSPLGQEFKPKFEDLPNFQPSIWGYVGFAALGIAATGVTLLTGGAGLPFALAVGGTTAAAGGFGSYLINAIGQMTNPGNQKTAIENMAKYYVKLYFIGEYIFANYNYNKCLQGKGDPYAWVNPNVLNILSSSLHPELDLSSFDPCGCEKKYDSNISMWKLGESIKASICSFLCQTYVFVQQRFQNAIAVLGQVIGVNLGGETPVDPAAPPGGVDLTPGD